jgi:hypothetical protein
MNFMKPNRRFETARPQGIWRRSRITPAFWFRDYVYLPLVACATVPAGHCSSSISNRCWHSGVLYQVVALHLLQILKPFIAAVAVRSETPTVQS